MDSIKTTLHMSNTLREGESLTIDRVQERFDLPRPTANRYLKAIEYVEPIETGHQPDKTKVWRWDSSRILDIGLVKLHIPEYVLKNSRSAARALLVSRALRTGAKVTVEDIVDMFGLSPSMTRKLLSTMADLQPLGYEQDGNCKVWYWRE